jgi:hypothetical protein
MTYIEKALLAIGVLAVAEAVWALAAPKNVRKIADWFIGTPGSKRPVLLGVVFVLIAAALWALILMGQPLSAWLLLGMAMLFVVFGWMCFNKGHFNKLLEVLLIRRSDLSVRLIYFVELVIAALLIWVAVAGK